MALLSVLPDLLSNIPLLAISLIRRMSLSLFHDMIDLKEGGNRRLVYKLFKTWRQKAIPRVERSSEKWECEKEVRNYLVTKT